MADASAAKGNIHDPGASGAADASHAVAQLPSTTATSPVQLARMVEHAAQSEMRIGLNTSAFGNVQVRTVVHASDVGVQIGSEKGDLRSLLANDIPGIVHKLQQQDLQLTQVSFQNGWAYSSDSSRQDGQPRPFTYRQNSEAASAQEFPLAEPDMVSEARNSTASGISILA